KSTAAPSPPLRSQFPGIVLACAPGFRRMGLRLTEIWRSERDAQLRLARIAGLLGAQGWGAGRGQKTQGSKGRHAMRSSSYRGVLGAVAVIGLAHGITPTAALAAWEPTRPVEFIVPAGTGGGADQMARTIQGIVTKHQLMKQSMVVINKSGGAGGEGFLDVKASRGNPHKLVITLSNLFTTPLGTGIPFNWKDLTPVAMMALDEFILWVNAETPYKTAQDYIAAVKGGAPAQFKMGGTGSKQEDQIITVAIEKAAGTKFTYIPYKGGGEVAVQLVGKH